MERKRSMKELMWGYGGKGRGLCVWKQIWEVRRLLMVFVYLWERKWSRFFCRELMITWRRKERKKICWESERVTWSGWCWYYLMCMRGQSFQGRVWIYCGKWNKSFFCFLEQQMATWPSSNHMIILYIHTYKKLIIVLN